jgi:amino acid adenylation domain-containing protein
MANTVVLRGDLRDDPTVRELLDRVRSTCLDAWDHQDVPFERLVEELTETRDQSRSPLFQVMLALSNVPSVELSLPGLRGGIVLPDNPTAKFDVVLNLADRTGTIDGFLEFDRDVYDARSLRSLGDAFLRALEAFTAGPDRRLSSVDVLGADQRSALLDEFNAVRGDYDHRTCLHRLVEAAADRHPDAVAVVGDDRALTYRQLDGAANAMAHDLIARGVRPDDIVGICLPRSIPLVVCELAVLKAGAAILPLDPQWPPARRDGVVADAECRLVLDGDSMAATEPPGNPSRPRVRVGPDHLAYVVYTSGSTGRPKGVAVPHRAICNNLLWMQHDWPLDGRDRLLHKTAATFDVSIKEIFWPLLAGARLVLATPGSEQDPQALLEQVERHGITVTHFVPSILSLILDLAERAGGPRESSLRYVMSGAETLATATQRRFAAISDAALLHMYGPTETAIAVTGWTCRRGDPETERVPLGRPMPHSRLYVLDDDWQPLPALAWGELYVGGAPVARGYLNRAAETAAAFVPDPFAPDPGSRMYRTGDQVRHGPQGLLEFRGRKDDQVKIRGFRVELGEVEAALRIHPAVRQAVVVVRDAGQPGAHLVAYAVGTAEPADLRRHLSDRLPRYLVPSAVRVLDRLPLGANGKVDRAALPDPGRLDREAGTEFVAPGDDLERLVAQVWSEALGIDPVGAHDDFFAIGGHSLQAAQIVAELKERLGRDVPLKDMFAEPTVAGLARLLRTAPRPALPRITPVRRSGAGTTPSPGSVEQ